MYRKIVIALSVALLSYNVCVSADRGGEKTGETVSECGETVLYEEPYIISNDEVERLAKSAEIMDGDGIAESDTGDIQPVDTVSNSDNGNIENVNEEISDTVSDDTISDNTVSDNEMIGDIDEKMPDAVSGDEISVAEEKDEEADGSDEIVSTGEEDLGSEETAIIKVSVPQSVQGYLDPENFSGKGGVYSDKYEIINYGNRDVVVKIKNIEAFFKEGKERYEFSEDAVGDEGSDIKKINIDMVWENESENIEKVLNVAEGKTDEYVLYLKASQYDENNEFVKLNDGSVGTFHISGTLNQNQDIQWSDNELTLRFDYQIQSKESMDESEKNGGFLKNALTRVEEETKSINEEY